MNYDDMPIGGGSGGKKNPFGGTQPFDELPIGGGKGPIVPEYASDSQPPPRSKPPSRVAQSRQRKEEKKEQPQQPPLQYEEDHQQQQQEEEEEEEAPPPPPPPSFNTFLEQNAIATASPANKPPPLERKLSKKALSMLGLSENDVLAFGMAAQGQSPPVGMASPVTAVAGGMAGMAPAFPAESKRGSINIPQNARNLPATVSEDGDENVAPSPVKRGPPADLAARLANKSAKKEKSKQNGDYPPPPPPESDSFPAPPAMPPPPAPIAKGTVGTITPAMS